MKQNKFLLGLTAFALTALLSLIATNTFAATFINVVNGPTWLGQGNGYTTTVCTDTAFGETVYTQITTDGTPLTGNNNTNPTIDASWNGNIIACSFSVFEPAICGGAGSGASSWTCTFPDTPNATLTFRFLVTNQSGDWYGQQTNTGSPFNTGPLAVTMQNLDTASPSSIAMAPFILLLLLTVATGGILLTQRSNQPN